MLAETIFSSPHRIAPPRVFRPRARRHGTTSLVRVTRLASAAIPRAEAQPLYLRPADCGWMLATSTGETAFAATGPDARGQCLRRAHLAGVLYVR